MAGIIEKYKEEWLESTDRNGESPWAFAGWLLRKKEKEIASLKSDVEHFKKYYKVVESIKKAIRDNQ